MIGKISQAFGKVQKHYQNKIVINFINVIKIKINFLLIYCKQRKQLKGIEVRKTINFVSKVIVDQILKQTQAQEIIVSFVDLENH